MSRTIHTAFGLIGASLAATAALAGGAAAEPRAASLLDLQVISEVVPYADLDLTSANGAQRMARRVEQAATRVCGGTLLHQGSPRLAHCRRQAIVLAMARFDAPLVTQALGMSSTRTMLARR